jgi:hypothetical protein
MRVADSLVLLLIFCAARSDADAEDSLSAAAGFEVPWSSIDAGGVVLEASGWRLSATVGQPDVSVSRELQGGGYRLRNGYWLTPAASSDTIFSNGFD